MVNCTVRRAGARDAGGLAECIDAAYSIYVTRIHDLPAVSAGVSGAIEHCRVWVAELENQIVAGMILDPRENFLLLENIAVRPEFSGIGLGRMLISRAEADCLELGLHEIRLSTHEGMPENVEIYARLGWTETARSGNKVHMSKVV